MLERLAAWFLNTYVAEYVGNVVTDQLSIGLLKGAVELEKLPLKRDALKKLNLPIDIKSGYIGKLKLQIPVRYIKSQPWVVQIDQLYIVAGPAKPGAYNEEEEATLAQAAKRVKLDKLEEEFKAEQQKNKGWWFWSPLTVSLPSNVIANLQIIVNDVHIRYEDQDADPSRSFSVGVMVENISAQSTDEDWEPKFVSGEDRAFKLVDLKNFTVYSDSDVFGELEGQLLVDAMLMKHGSVITQQQPMTASTIFGATPTTECLVKPVNGQAKLTRNCSKTPLKISDGPRFHLDVQLDEIPIFLSDCQYESLMHVFETFNLRFKARKFQRMRPLVGVAGNPGQWWRFAIETALHKIRQRNKTRSRGFTLKRAQQNVSYVFAYTQHLTQEVMSEELKEEMELIEEEQSFEELAVLRKLAMSSVKKQRGLVEAVRQRLESETQSSNQGILQRWFPGWMSGEVKSQPVSPDDYEPSADNSEYASDSMDMPTSSLNEGRLDEDNVLSEEDELLNELGYESQDSVFHRDRIFLTLSFSLTGGSFQLVSTPTSLTDSFLGPEPLVELAFSSLCCSVDLRPKLRYATFDLSLGSLSVQDHTDPDSLFPVLVQPKGFEPPRVSSDRTPLLQRQYTVFDPLDTTPGSSSLFELKLVAEEVNHCKHYQVSVQSKPLDIVYNPSTIARVKQFLATPQGGRSTMDKLSREIQSQTTAGLKNKLEDIFEGDTKMGGHSVLSIKLDISAPHIILPEDFKNEDTSLVVLDLGHVTFGNVSDWSTEELGLEVQRHLSGGDEDDDDDDLFQTPLSSPPSEEEEAIDSAPLTQPLPPDTLPGSIQSAASLRRRQVDPYERYLLRLSDLQVLVGKAGEDWKEATRSGRSSVHLLDKFTLSFQIQRMVRPIPGSLEPSVSLSANLPSLRFNIDEDKVHTVISCLRTMRETHHDENELSTPPTQDSPAHDMLSSSIYQSAYSLEDFDTQHSLTGVQASMYHSAISDPFFNEEEDDSRQNILEDSGRYGRRKDGGSSMGTKETHHRKVLFARERQFTAQLAINEALLCVSSRGRLITELRVPGIRFGFVKRPYDIGLQVLVQDLFLVDRIQSFGPGYELVICSSGRTLLDVSPSCLSPTTSTPSIQPLGLVPSQFPAVQTTAVVNDPLLSPKLVTQEADQVDYDVNDYSVFSNDGLPNELFSSSLDQSGHALLAFSYSLLTPDSPQHPATRDQDEDEITSVGDEPNIHKISVECTSVDAIANQEVIMELISFFHRALPEGILPQGGVEDREDTKEEKQLEVPLKPLHTELSVKFEQLGIRMLRRIVSSNTHLQMSQGKEATSATRLISEIILYGLTAEGTVSTDVLFQGKVEGIRVTDLTPAGKKYPDILLMGAGSGLEQRAVPSHDPGIDTAKQSLSFSISRSPRPLNSLHSQLTQHFSDIHLSAFVPTIRYTHSVNFVCEMEIFVSEFQSYSSLVSKSFKTAAVGVARGFVSEESQLARGLSKLHVSFGRTLSRNCPSCSSDDLSDSDELDAGDPVGSNDRIYFDFSVQSPVIVLPSSLKKDDCLIAHLGEITISNEFVNPQEPNTTSFSESFSAPSLNSIDRLTVSITRVSLHATRNEESRKQLLSGQNPNLSSSKKCFKVLRETSAMVQVDKRLGQANKQDLDTSFESLAGTNAMNAGVAELVITGKICDPLLVRLPKEVFDQIRSTLKHGIRRKPPKPHYAKTTVEIDSPSKSQDKTTASQSVESGMRSIPEDSNSTHTLPSIYASFKLPKLSLELKHTLESAEKNLVYVSFDGFSVECSMLDPHVLTFDLTLKSIIIEDLLQPENSDYRYILASSIKPLPLISPVPTPTKSLQTLSSCTNNLSSLSRHIFPFSQLMSTPKPRLTSLTSPLQSFDPLVEAENDDGYNNSKSSSGSRVTSQSSELQNESGTTLVDGEQTVTREDDLLTIKAVYVEEKCPVYSTKYNSESLHAGVDFSSVYVVINLQTWVVLFDYLGIGIPTPPPSRSMSPDLQDRDEPLYFHADKGVTDENLMTGSTHVPLVDQSLLEDALDFTSLGSVPASSLYASAWQSLSTEREHREDNTANEQRKCLSSDSDEDSVYAGTDEEVQAGNSVWGVDEKLSMGIELNVKSLTVTFNKPEHPLARGNVSLVSAQVKMRRGNVEIGGRLGQASVSDLTETGAYYRERFTTTGEQALTFDIFKYGRPDPFMERPYDVTVKVVMSSVRYLHTMRFLKEILSFLSHFPQLIDAFQRMKAMAEGNLVYHGPERKARLSFDVDVAGPLLLIPKHAFSPDLMVGDIGHVRVTNAIRYDGEEGTISFMRKHQGLDEIRSITGTYYGPPGDSAIPRHILSPQASAQSLLTTISDGSISSTISHTHPSLVTSLGSSNNPRLDSFSSSATLEPKLQESFDNSMFGSSAGLSVEEDRQRIEKQLEAFKGPCLLDCIEVELSDVDVFSAKKVRTSRGGSKIVRQPGNVLKEKGAAKLYIERNLYEDFCRDVPDFHVEGTLQAIHVLLDKPQLEVIKGLIEMNLGETIEEFEKPSTVIHDPVAQPIATDVWTGFLFRMQFAGVQLELLQSRHNEAVPGSITRSLARFEIQETEFSFEARSNQCQTVDLTSRSVIGYDTRYEDYDQDAKPSVFEEILRPRFSSKLENDSKRKAIQVEIHVALSPKQIKASILLNKLRLMGIFDLILELKSFVLDDLPEDDDDEDSFDELNDPYPQSPAATTLLQQQLASYKVTRPHRREVKKPPRDILVKLSVTETDFVVVEDTRLLSSNAVVLKSTLILKFQSTKDSEKSINCSIDGLELFSCSLSNEDETALSILDPVSVSVDVKPSGPQQETPRGKQTADESVTGSAQILEVEIQQLNFRLSYNDIKLFMAIAQSLSTLGSIEVRESVLKQGEKNVDENLVKRLLPLGFTKSSIRKELYLHGNDPNAAAIRLLSQQEEEEARESISSSENDVGTDSVDDGGDKEGENDSAEKPFTIKSIEVRLGSLSVCLIDDCVNQDVPLLDFSVVDFQAEHHLMVAKRGRARGMFAGDYYNRNISAWEPVVEQWNLQLDWQILKKYSTDLDSNDRPDRMCLTVASGEKFCVNVTSSLVHILKATQASWRQDLEKQNGGDMHVTRQTSSSSSGGGCNRQQSSDRTGPISSMEKGLALLHSVRFVSQTRQRSRFVPFLLRNSTGLPLMFNTLTSVPSKVYVSPSALYEKTRVSGRYIGGMASELSQTSEWMEVTAGEEKPFDFSSKGKMRHRDTRELVVHQLLVKVAGWERIHIPISVDKIGVFFREVWPTNDTDLDSLPEIPLDRGPVRLVFAISLSDTQKVVNVRSALVLVNTMELPLEVKLENNDANKEHGQMSRLLTPVTYGSTTLPPLVAKGYLAIPIHQTSWSVRVRPQGWGVQYCSRQLAWRHVSGKSSTSHTRECEAIGEGVEPPFRFCVSVRRENFPVDSAHPHPAHTITLYPPLTVANLLPCDLQFCLVKNGLRKIIKRGKEIAVYSVDSMRSIEFKVALEGFVYCQSCVVSMDTVGRPQGMSLEDTEKRPLRLSVTSEVLGGTALKVSVFCTYWLINRTGLPLVFKQDGVSQVAASQHEENEKASTTSPLLFSYSNGELIESCTMRLGNKYRYLNGGQPVWCAPFRMISGSGVIRVFVRSKDGRPDLEYQIGVDIRRGRRQYQGTRVVTLVARYQLENKTQYKMAYVQRHQLQDEELVRNRKIPIIMPSAVMSFHWPRIDLDQLLCIKVEDISDCQWSGGFSLDKDRSFHIQMRGRFGHSVFVRCEVTLISATFHIILSNAANYPPPFRLENLSQMPVTYHQARTTTVSTLNPGQSVPYAWDEPMLPETMCLQIKGVDDFKEFDFNTFGTRGKLYYESYFYVSAIGTFSEERGGPVVQSRLSPSFSTTHQRKSTVHQELVLDVPQGTAVIFQRKDPEKRTQLWRMSASRQLVHIVSSSQDNTNMVLDIAGGKLPGKGQVVPLVIKRANSSRSLSQTWRFTEDCRLLLDDTPYLCVQSRPGYENMREGVDATVGHLLGGYGPVPHEQMLRRMKHSPGSGVLSVNVISDGPTRTLRVTDVNNKYTHSSAQDDWVIVEHGLVAPATSSDVDSCQDNSWESDDGEPPSIELELSLVLEEGIGVSLINSIPEELIFATLSGIRVEFISSSIHQCLNATVQHIQVDNNLATSHTPVLAFPTPPSSGLGQEATYPVLKVVAEKVPHKSPFAQVFKLLEFKVQNITLLLEEKLLFKLLQWAGVGQAQEEEEAKEEEIMNMLTLHRVSTSSSSRFGSMQIYFEHFKISDIELRVSMLTTSQLPEDLLKIKRHLGFPLVKFESPIYLDGIHQAHVLGDAGVYVDSLTKHYKGVVKSQSIKILGSVDFLGNPVGLLTDVASGVTGLIAVQPDVFGLVRDVAHGMSDTTSKLTGTVSHMFGQATLDSSYQEEREQILESCQSSSDHFKAGLMGLSSGVFGGVTSIMSQPYKGAQEYGFGGFLAGIGKGVIGTVAKPVAGLFDFASGTTAALRESTSRVSRYQPTPVRHRRCCVGASGALTPYSISQARGQEYLMRLTDGKVSEKLVSYDLLYESPTNRKDRMKVIVSSQYLYFFRDSPPDPKTLDSQISLDDLAECRPAQGKTSIPTVYIVLSLIDKDAAYRAPKYKCSDENKARKVAQLINYAKNFHEEEKHVVRTLRLQCETIW